MLFILTVNREEHIEP